MSIHTAKIFEALCLGFNNPYPPEPLNSDDWNRIEDPRPCFDKMLSTTGIEADSRPEHMLFALAKEFRRRGYNYLAIKKEISRFNEHNFKRPLSRRNTERSILGFERTELYHCCSHQLLEEYCIGKEKCSWLKSVTCHSKKEHSDQERFESMYSRLLRTDEKRVYLRFLEIEIKNHLHAGEKIFRSYRQLAIDLNFKDKGIVQRACKKLERLGLLKIAYEGKGARAATGLCSGFQRISPVPPPQLPEKEDKNV